MTLREFIDLLEEAASETPEGDKIEVVTLCDGETCAPCVAVGKDRMVIA